MEAGDFIHLCSLAPSAGLGPGSICPACGRPLPWWDGGSTRTTIWSRAPVIRSLTELASLQRLFKMDAFLLSYILVWVLELHGTILAFLSCKSVWGKLAGQMMWEAGKELLFPVPGGC